MADHTIPALGTPERTWWRRGAAAEAQLREAPRKALPGDVREVLNYADALAKHQPEQISTPGALLVRQVYVFRSTLTRADRRAIRRALRGKR
ncbi:hypothetical protein [Pimelobacter simplex]|uniref:hypothetical protein n=1 Tax=Nocardioides simplex TaxID=2045 RepID=UPI00214F8F58|nr:hypothetical protein [Pimelobacter simplex]UUW88381.1 hypothetical protein M0M43_21915 [Pimelobacter simplex]UUW97885.1 hypothetical protein M0M48_10560 [Pimelobacter simplex]